MPEPTDEVITPSSDEARRNEEGTPTAAMLVGIALAPLVCIWVFRSEILHHSADLASNALSLAAVGVLLCLLGVRAFHRPLRRQSIILIYAAVAGTVGISTMGMVQFLVTTLLAPFHFASPANRYEEFWSAIPAWAAPRSPELVKGFFLGHSSLYSAHVWKAWLVPVAAWGVFILALLTAQYCLAHLLYPRWAKEERLTFPIVQLPLTLTDPTPGRRYVLLAGAAVAVAIQGLNAVHAAVPSVPGLNVLPVEVGSKLPAPWNGLGTMWTTFYPCIIGLSALVPVNILFSGVFFFVLTKLENLATSTWGLAGSGGGGIGFPYPAEQAQGAMLALAMIVLWSARRSLRRSFENRADRIAWAVLAVSCVVLISFGVALGLRPMVALLLFGVFFLMMVSAGWIRAAVGLVWNPGCDVSWWTRAFAGGGAGVGEGVGMAYMRWFSFGDFRAHGLPTYVDSMRLAEAVDIRRRTLLTALAVGSVLSVFASLWVALEVYYQNGAATALTDGWRTYQGRMAFEALRSQMDGLSPRPGLAQLGGAAFGGAVVVALHWANLALTWWPLHPAGFVMAQTGALEWMWLPMTIAAVAKSIMLRTGGLKLYRRALPFFVGLILGDYAISIVLTILGRLLHTTMYKPFPI